MLGFDLCVDPPLSTGSQNSKTHNPKMGVGWGLMDILEFSYRALKLISCTLDSKTIQILQTWVWKTLWTLKLVPYVISVTAFSLLLPDLK